MTRFFEDNTPRVFNLEFAAITLVDLVACEPARESLRTASESLASGDTAEAMSAIAVAFAQSVDDYETRVQERYGRSPFLFGASFAFETSFFRGRHRDPFASREQISFEDKLRDTVVALQEAIKPLALGLDYRRYAKFMLLAPHVSRTWDGTYNAIIVTGLHGSPNWPPSIEACRFGFDFVIDAAIRLQDFTINED